MIVRRAAQHRGQFDHGWLQSAHSFSFADYYDPEHMGFHSLRVINEDHIAPGKGFATHPHRDMEILTWVLAGQIAHKDSMGHSAVSGPGEIQAMSAGSGIAHSEFNASTSQPLHLLQIWILPREAGLPPRYQQRRCDEARLHNRLFLLAAPPEQESLVDIHQDARVWVGRLDVGQQLAHRLEPDRGAWIQVAKGAITLNQTRLDSGDGAAVSGEEQLQLTALAESEVLVFDLL